MGAKCAGEWENASLIACNPKRIVHTGLLTSMGRMLHQVQAPRGTFPKLTDRRYAVGIPKNLKVKIAQPLSPASKHSVRTRSTS